MGSHQDFNELTHGITFRNQWGWQQRSVLAIKGKTPGSKPRTFLWWAFFCLLRPRGVRAPVPWRLVRTPRVSRHFAASRKHKLQTTTSYLRSAQSLIFPTPLDSGIPLVTGTTCVQKGGAPQGRPCGRSVNEGAVERGTMTAVCKTTTRTGTLFPTPLDDGTVTPHEHKARRRAVEERNARNVQYAPGSQDQHLPAAYAPLQLAAQVYERR
jgi:hypothetical protein